MSAEEIRAPSRTLEVLLTAAATALAVAFLASAPYLTRESLNNPIPSFIAQSLAAPAEKAPLHGPSILASVPPAPDLNLSLPSDIAVIARRTGINGETGLIPTARSITTFRLVATGDLVSVAAPTGLDPVQPVRGDPDRAFRVRGFYASASSERGFTILRCTERGVTYEVSSRTLDPGQLAEIANKLR